jgi:hypothetical protein
MMFIDANPDTYFYLFDTALALCIYGISIVLFLTYKRGNLGPILFLGLFIFPLQFSMWFLKDRVHVRIPIEVNMLEILYLFLVKISVLVTLLRARR